MKINKITKSDLSFLTNYELKYISAVANPKYAAKYDVTKFHYIFNIFRFIRAYYFNEIKHEKYSIIKIDT